MCIYAKTYTQMFLVVLFKHLIKEILKVDRILIVIEHSTLTV